MPTPARSLLNQLTEDSNSTTATASRSRPTNRSGRAGGLPGSREVMDRPCQTDTGYRECAREVAVASGRATLDKQVNTCLSFPGGRPVQGPRRPDPACHPRRAAGTGRPDAVRAVHPADQPARRRLEPPGRLPAPRRARGRGAGHPAPGGPVHVPAPAHHTAAGHHRSLARRPPGGPLVKIAMTSVLVDDQEKALRFYTDVLGFVTKNDIPMGEHRWLTV